jgi:hypothetical protein
LPQKSSGSYLTEYRLFYNWRIRNKVVWVMLAFRKPFQLYSAFFLTVAIGNCMVKLIPPVNFCSDENIQTIFAKKLEDFLNYPIDYNSIS